MLGGADNASGELPSYITGANTVIVNRSAQVQTQADLTDTKSKCRDQMSD